jgi:hypothetical protein
MCNLYSITTNQAAIIALFRVINRCRRPAANARRASLLSGASDLQHGSGHRDGDDALGHATTAAHRRSAGHQHPQHVIAALPRLAEAGEPVLGPGQ